MILSADRIFDGRTWLKEGTQLEVDDQGYLLRLGQHLGAPDHHWSGVLTPGWVNAHTHVELSFMKGRIPEGTGLVGFLEAVMAIRRLSEAETSVSHAMAEAIREMADSGIVALGDIANGKASLTAGLESGFHLHRFVELIGLSEVPDKAAARGMEVRDAFRRVDQSGKFFNQSLVPHAPYSVSEGLFRWLDSQDPRALLSIHNQETDQEDLLYLSAEGALKGFLQRIVSPEFWFPKTGTRAWKGYSAWISPTHPLILVHNTFSRAEDVDQAMARYPQLYWCLCPQANLYIERRLPPVQMLMKKRARICLGTDSLASNHQLSILEEMRALKEGYPELEWKTLLHWATMGGAEALQMQGFLGHLRPGIAPGLVWVPDLYHGPSRLVVPSHYSG